MSATIGHIGLTTTVDGEPRLVGARCEACATQTFPFQHACPRCGGATAELALPARGSVWSWTVQRNKPKPPYRDESTEFVPFAVGYVDLGGVRVESRLSGRAVEGWSIGDPVRLEVEPPESDDALERFRFVPDGGQR